MTRERPPVRRRARYQVCLGFRIRNLGFGAGLLVLALIAALAPVACSKSEAPKTGPAPEVSAPIYKVEKTETPDFYEVSGTVTSRNPAQMVAKVTGTVGEVTIVEGQRVRKGDLLVLIDAPDIQAARDQARASSALAESTLRRYEPLFRERAISPQEYEEVQTKRNVAADELRRTEALLSYARITAPVNGIITHKEVSVGSIVMPGTPVLTIETEEGLRIEVDVDEKLLSFVKKGMAIPVFFELLGREVTGTVDEVVPAIDRQSRTFKVRVSLPPDAAPRLGAYGTVRIPVGTAARVLVPPAALHPRGQLTYVYVLDDGGIASLRLVRTGKTVRGMTEITSGLDPGVRIVAAFSEKVREGVKVVP